MVLSNLIGKLCHFKLPVFLLLVESELPRVDLIDRVPLSMLVQFLLHVSDESAYNVSYHILDSDGYILRKRCNGLPVLIQRDH